MANSASALKPASSSPFFPTMALSASLECAFWFGERCDCRTQETDKDSSKPKAEEKQMVDEIQRKWRISPRLSRSYGVNRQE
jgi:hypothetical protein